MNIQFNFKNRGALITGGARGIGFMIAKRFLDAGANVIIWDYSEELLQVAASELAAFGKRIHVTKVDVRDYAACLREAQNNTFPVEILVNNAGITRDKSFKKMTQEDFQAVINTNLIGLFNVTKAIYDCMPETYAHKRIINISSIVARYGNFGQSNYVAAKAGVIGLTKTWAREFARKGFTVNAIAPGFIGTEMVASMPQDAIVAISSKIPLGRLGTTEDIANTCLFLAAEEAQYINGEILGVDGGLVC